MGDFHNFWVYTTGIRKSCLCKRNCKYKVWQHYLDIVYSSEKFGTTMQSWHLYNSWKSFWGWIGKTGFLDANSVCKIWISAFLLDIIMRTKNICETKEAVATLEMFCIWMSKNIKATSIWKWFFELKWNTLLTSVGHSYLS